MIETLDDLIEALTEVRSAHGPGLSVQIDCAEDEKILIKVVEQCWHKGDTSPQKKVIITYA